MPWKSGRRTWIIRILQQAPTQYKQFFPILILNAQETWRRALTLQLALLCTYSFWEQIFFFLEEGHGPLKDKGIWNMSLATKLCFWTRIWVGSLLEINEVPTNYFWKVTFLCSFFQVILFPGHAQLCCAVKTGSFQPRTTGSMAGTLPATAVPAAGQPLGRGQNSVSASQITPRLSKHWSTSWPHSCLGGGE